jgi:hypothetical protein
MSYELDGEPLSSVFIPIGMPVADTDDRRRSSSVDGKRSVATRFECASPPTDTPKVSNTSYTLETDQAVELGVNYVGTGNLNIDKKMKVFVREYAKYGTCESTNGKATLKFGAVWRATVLIDQVDASGAVTFAMVAASATLKNLSVQVSITHEGFAAQDRKAIDDASSKAMNATAQGLNVSSFVKFSEQVEIAVKAAMGAKVTAPLYLLGYQPHESDQLLESVVRTFALSYISRGAGCMDPIADFPIKNSNVEKVIKETYSAISSTPCDASDKATQLTAQRLLAGIKVRLPFW